MLHEHITEKIIKSFYRVYNSLGHGFLEKVYENALRIELRSCGLNCRSQVPVSVYYKKEIVGQYYADFVVEGVVVLELKTVDIINPAHEAQLINYLKATGIEVGILLNFGPKPSFIRRILTSHQTSPKHVLTP